MRIHVLDDPYEKRDYPRAELEEAERFMRKLPESWNEVAAFPSFDADGTYGGVGVRCIRGDRYVAYRLTIRALLDEHTPRWFAQSVERAFARDATHELEVLI